MTSFTIESPKGVPRLICQARLDARSDFEDIVRALSAFKCKVFRARKISFVAARQATAAEAVETRYNGRESQNTAKPGDWIVTNMDEARNIIRDAENCANTYVIQPDAFARLYARSSGSSPFGDVYKAKGVVDAIEVAGGFDIVAPWGERQQGPGGYLLRNGDDVYGIHKDAFNRTYEIVP